MLKITINVLFYFLFIFSSVVNAENRYVSDELTILMRSDKGVGFRILKSLKSGEKIRIIKFDKSGYAKAKTQSGVVGWVLTSYLS